MIVKSENPDLGPEQPLLISLIILGNLCKGLFVYQRFIPEHAAIFSAGCYHLIPLANYGW